MDEIKLEQLEEMQKDLFKKQCDLDIQKAFVKHFIKKKQSEQLNIHSVVVPKVTFNCGKERAFGEERCKAQCKDCVIEYQDN